MSRWYPNTFTPLKSIVEALRGSEAYYCLVIIPGHKEKPALSLSEALKRAIAFGVILGHDQKKSRPGGQPRRDLVLFVSVTKLCKYYHGQQDNKDDKPHCFSPPAIIIGIIWKVKRYHMKKSTISEIATMIRKMIENTPM